MRCSGVLKWLVFRFKGFFDPRYDPRLLSAKHAGGVHHPFQLVVLLKFEVPGTALAG